jgi:hypothetical protein
MSQLLTEAEAARRLLISLSNLREIRRRGGIRYVAMSARRIAYRPEDCDEYVLSHLRIEEARPEPKPKGRRRSMSGARPETNIIPFSQRKRQSR